MNSHDTFTIPRHVIIEINEMLSPLKSHTAEQALRKLYAALKPHKGETRPYTHPTCATCAQWAITAKELSELRVGLCLYLQAHTTHIFACCAHKTQTASVAETPDMAPRGKT